MGEFQQDWLGSDSVPVNFKAPRDLVRDFTLLLQQKGLTRSFIFRLLMMQMLKDERTMHDPRQLEPVMDAIRELKEFIPFAQRYGLQKNT